MTIEIRRKRTDRIGLFAEAIGSYFEAPLAKAELPCIPAAELQALCINGRWFVPAIELGKSLESEWEAVR